MKTENHEQHDEKVKEILTVLKGLKVRQAIKVLFEAMKKLEEAVY